MTEEEKEPRRHAQGSEDAEQAAWLAEDFERSVKYDHGTGRWHIFNEKTGIWVPDGKSDVQERVTEFAKRRIVGVALSADGTDETRKAQMKIYRRLFEKARVESALAVLAWSADYKTDGADWDQDPNLLGCANGVVDLRYNKLVAPSPTMLVSRSTGHKFIPMNDWSEVQQRAPILWRSLLEWTSNDVDLAVFYLLWFGYSLFGHTQEQRFLILTGIGRNGKGALADAVRHVFGEYSAPADQAIYIRHKFGSARSDGARADLMALKGKRVAIMSEPLGGEFNEELLKAHTGGDPITARALYSNNVISWKPTHSITFLTNQPPTVTDIGPAMAARVMVADFNERFDGDKENKKLYGELEGEAEGILAILVFAAKTWYESENGMELPERVVRASADYLTTNDPMGRALNEAFVIEKGAKSAGSLLYDTYTEWFERSGQDGDAMTATGFGLALTKRGFTKIKVPAGMQWQNIRPKSAIEVMEGEDVGPV